MIFVETIVSSLKTISSSAVKVDPLEGFENSIKNIKKNNDILKLKLPIKVKQQKKIYINYLIK